MEESILVTIKKLLGIDENYDAFDLDILTHINSCLFTLSQLGVGYKNKGFVVTGKNETWSDFLSDISNYQGVKTYIYLKVKLIFDPPTSSFVIEAMNGQIKELEWRLNLEAEEGGDADGIQ